MSALQSLQRRFLDQVVKHDPAVIEDIVDIGPLDRAQRLSIYANAFSARLTEALSIDHEVLQKYLGEDQFHQMAQSFIERHPSTFTSLRHYGDRLPDFLSTQDPYQELGQVAEIAKFERLLLDAFDAADSARVTLDKLVDTAPEAWPQILLQFVPSLRQFDAHWNSVDIWRALKHDDTPPSPQHSASPTCWLIWRGPTRLSEFRSLDAAEAIMLNAFIEGESFAGACEALLSVVPEDEIAAFALQHLSRWIEGGLVSSLTAA